MALIVLHPGYKFVWFKEKWTLSGEARASTTIKSKLRQMWQTSHKKDNVQGRAKQPLSPEKKALFLEGILNNMAPLSRSRVAWPTRGKDKLFLYLAEPLTDHLGLMEYWRSRES
jgi:hypothetical protein